MKVNVDLKEIIEIMKKERQEFLVTQKEKDIVHVDVMPEGLVIETEDMIIIGGTKLNKRKERTVGAARSVEKV
ncbi:hypothetical protein [Cytobacillus luteolus]|uniref:hypothetical protein n=1 Tax=Litchfieldia luteola TaxID=682179 RepID=UPI001AEB7BB4|nr:hypothetical protein [Cytobacillus luteolus]MBP1944646.1 hypothetical protein [Cytobacillus luteolus]